MTKLSSFIVGLIAMATISTVIGLFYAEIAETHGKEYDNATLGAYNNLTQLTALTEEIEGASSFEEDADITDVIGSYVRGGIQVLTVGKQSVNTFDTVANSAVQDANIGPAGGIIKKGLVAMVLVVLIIGVIVAALLKWPV